MVICPDSAETASLNLMTMLASTATPVARVAGVVDEIVGAAARAGDRPAVKTARQAIVAVEKNFKPRFMWNPFPMLQGYLPPGLGRLWAS